MELKDIRKAFHKAVNDVFEQIEQASERTVAQRVDQLQTAMQEKLDKALGGKGTVKLGVRGAKPGVQPCKLTGAPSGGPRYNYLTKEVHAKLYADRTNVEGGQVVQAILEARARGEQHPEDPGAPAPALDPVAPEETVTETLTRVLTEPAPAPEVQL